MAKHTHVKIIIVTWKKYNVNYIFYTNHSESSTDIMFSHYQGDEKEPKDVEEAPPRARSYDQHKQSHDNGKYAGRRGPTHGCTNNDPLIPTPLFLLVQNFLKYYKM